MRRHGYGTLLILLLASQTLLASDPGKTKPDKMQWFNDAKLGIFIHWGIYAVNGIDESWSFFNENISYDDYMKQLDGFTAQNYDPIAWAKLIKESGARYSVITTKHHDGIALWDTQAGNLSTVKSTAAGKDMISPFVTALRKENLKVGLYYSHCDWSHPDYPNWTRNKKRYEEDDKRWRRFMRFHAQQLKELQTQFQPDLIWFDGDWEQSAERWDAKGIRRRLLKRQPELIINSRLRGHGDYATPEQGLPIVPPERKWELCLTMNNSWGYQQNDKEYKTPYQIIRIFCDCISMGGNLLLDIGPRADGTIPEQEVALLRALGCWTKKHDQAIFGTVAGLPYGHYYGPSTLAKDRKTLYLFVPHKPNGPLVVRGLKSDIAQVRIVGNGTRLSSKEVGKLFWSDVPGILYIDLPESQLDPQVTVIALELKDELELYREKKKQADE